MSRRLSRRSLLAATATSVAPLRRARAGLAQELTTQGTPTATPIGPTIPPELRDAARNWPTANGGLRGLRRAEGSAIDASTVAALVTRWSVPITVTTGYGGMTATPIVVGDRVYIQDMRSNVAALDRESGATVWSYPVDQPCIGPNGVGVGYGLVVGATGDSGEVFALDHVTGAERWRVRLTNNPGEGIDMAPLVYDGAVYVSTVAGSTASFNAGGARGVFFALDAATGVTLWQFDTTSNLWGAPRINSGGGLWYPPSIDDDGNLYVGVANAGPWPGIEDQPNGASRPGSNPYASSMVCLDGATGEVRWALDAAPHDLLDHDFQNTPLLVDVENDDDSLRLAIGSGKTGVVIAVDRATGRERWRTAVGIHSGEPDASGFAPGERRAVSPGAWGGVLTPIASDGTMVVASVVNFPTIYGATGYDKGSMFALQGATGVLVGIDVVSGAMVWETTLPTMPTAGVTIAGNVALTSGLDGIFRAFGIGNGTALWQADMGAGVNAAPAIAGDEVMIPAAATRIRGGSQEPGESRLTALILRHDN